MARNYKSASKVCTYWITALSVLFSNLEHIAKTDGNINLTQSLVLLTISICKNPMKIGDVGRILDLKANTTTAALNNLEGLGLVKRERSDRDRRETFVSPTKAGKTLSHDVEQKFIDYIDKFIAEYLPDERSHFIDIIMEHATLSPLLDTCEDKSSSTVIIFFMRRMYLEFSYYLRRIGVNLVEARILLFCNFSEGTETLSEIGSTLFLHQNMLSTAVNSLAKKGLIDKKVSEQDSRASHITLTTAGKELVRKIADTSKSYLDRQGFDTKRASQLAERLKDIDVFPLSYL